MLAVAAQREHRLAVHQAEIRSALLNLHIRQQVQETVVVGRGHALKGGDALRRQAHGLHDVKALLPLCEELRQELGRMLHISVHRDDRIAVRMIDAAGQRKLMPVVAREKNRSDAGIPLAKRAQDLTAAVGGTVVDEEQLIVIGQTPHHLLHRRRKMRDVLLLVVDRNDD